MIKAEEINEIFAWLSDPKTIEELKPEEFGLYIGAVMEFASKLKPIYDAHHTQTYEWLLRDLFGGK